jgi:hypothetical protein
VVKGKTPFAKDSPRKAFLEPNKYIRIVPRAGGRRLEQPTFQAKSHRPVEKIKGLGMKGKNPSQREGA